MQATRMDIRASGEAPKARIALALALAAALGLVGCVSKTVRVVDLSPPQQVHAGIPEDMLLDVGVSVFDANVPKSFDERVERNINPEVRRAEANYMAFFAKNMLQSTGNWGAVRVAPRETFAVDVVVTGSIAHSDGERMELDVTVTDARGVVWFERNYLTLASKYAYQDGIPPGIDPFQATYRQLADDMLAFYQTLSRDDIHRIRTTAEMRFARDFSPEAFESYVQASDSGWELRRLPAQNDPMLGRVRQVREREYLFIDTLDEHYDNFHAQMSGPYQDWRAATYDEAIAYRRVTEKAKRKTLIGAAALAGGILAQASDSDVARYGGATGIIAGATLSVSAVGDRAEAKLHSEVLQELGTSAEGEISSHTIELENQTLRLQGTVDDQYEQLRRILKRIYLEELELALPADDDDTDLETGFDADEAFRRAAAGESACEQGGCSAKGRSGWDGGEAGGEREPGAGSAPGRFIDGLDGDSTNP